MRTDLPGAQKTVQACHAVIEATRHFLTPDLPHPHLTICGVKDEAALLHERSRLEALGVNLLGFNEPDRDNQLTAIATEPLSGSKRRLMRRYKILDEGA